MRQRVHRACPKTRPASSKHPSPQSNQAPVLLLVGACRTPAGSSPFAALRFLASFFAAVDAVLVLVTFGLIRVRSHGFPARSRQKSGWEKPEKSDAERDE